MKTTCAENQSPILILIVDDEKFIRMQLRLALEREGYEIAEAENGREALNLVEQLHPDIILLDAIMPDMDGFECCNRLQSVEFSQHTPVLMITGLDDQESVDRAFEVGAIDFVTKPIHWPVLRQRVKLLISQSQVEKQLQSANQELQRLVTIDQLTQISNRRRFEEYLTQEWQRMAREQLPISLIFGDIDFFKLYNDTYGHQVGDRCLQQVAQSIKNTIKRPADLVARYGGEEFVVILPNTDKEGAIILGEIICSVVRKQGIPHSRSLVSSYVTISAGVATLIPQPRSDYQEIITLADQALYQAKKAGRDRLKFI
ncbi:response regulator [Nodularia sphaerocarpa]|uniref:response regulator n=1 Tax=Nodularia sphaerocarpa TaxID=137816 RepID=UPI001EFAF331|nr:PleD family two-component system response regulator [Nodularia sphaerocarpa]MDB9373823.1 PleD family two-component system response regulator [Nodularia sphaerocarpa CS-585]MDB9380425.1 PleD family two-component system response regulator [Nodularia sphaerocarpa CS-585A2]ULP72868.1 Phytochrome-like protein cph2 [Nodularia sphaerocarpa UHCC 0038]